jgi:hypothetical protein
MCQIDHLPVVFHAELAPVDLQASRAELLLQDAKVCPNGLRESLTDGDLFFCDCERVAFGQEAVVKE